MTNRVLPHDLDAERSVLGAVLLQNEMLPLVSGSLPEEDFFRDAHRRIYRAMIALAEQSRAVDLITLTAQLGDDLTKVGGPAYVASLIDGVPRSTNIEDYARLVSDKALLRRLIVHGTEMVSNAHEAGADAQESLGAAEEAIYRLGAREAGGMLADGPQMASEGFGLIERLQASGRIVDTPTGLSRLDDTMLGLHPKHLTIVAARPGMGKSAFMLALARHVGMTMNQPTVVFSLEMAREELVLRMISAEAGVDGHAMNSGRVAHSDYPRLSRAIDRIGNSQLFVDDSAGRSMMQVRSQCRRLKARLGSLKVVFIDYLQLMTPARKREQNREQEVGAMAWACKQLAKEMDIAVVLLSQLSRSAEQRAGDRPKLSDLRESGQIEQHADDVLFIHPPATPNGTCELIVAKQRNGPKCSVHVGYDAAQYKFWNLAAE